MSTTISRDMMSLVFLGHVDSGKSTLVGNLLALTGAVPAAHVARVKREAEAAGRPTFSLAWLSDHTRTERDRGVSIDLTIHKIKTPRREWTICDAPGHLSFAKNAVTGTSGADACVLVVPAPPGEFEASMSGEGSARQHALVAFTLGIRHCVVAVNKMDDASVRYSQDRFDEVSEAVVEYLEQVGFDPDAIEVVPISAYEGVNLGVESGDAGADANAAVPDAAAVMPWYEGGSLADAMDALPTPERQPDAPLRFATSAAFKIGGVGTVPAGIVASGTLRVGERLACAPAMVTTEVRSIEVHRESVQEAPHGCNVGFNAAGITVTDVARGTVFGPVGEDAPRPARSFTAQIVVLDHPGDLMVGYTPVLDIHTAHVACRVSEIHGVVDRFTGEISDEEPRALHAGEAAIVTLTPQRPLIVERAEDYPQLGRFIMRDMKRVVAVGVVRDVERDEVTPIAEFRAEEAGAGGDGNNGNGNDNNGNDN